jgi:hypothetical protein
MSKQPDSKLGIPDLTEEAKAAYECMDETSRLIPLPTDMSSRNPFDSSHYKNSAVAYLKVALEKAYAAGVLSRISADAALK